MMQVMCHILNLCCMMWNKKKIVVRGIMGCQSLSLLLSVMFVLAWTIGDASSLSCQSQYQVSFVCSMSNGIIESP
jgi:hypothetical protein